MGEGSWNSSPRNYDIRQYWILLWLSDAKGLRLYLPSSGSLAIWHRTISHIIIITYSCCWVLFGERVRRYSQQNRHQESGQVKGKQQTCYSAVERTLCTLLPSTRLHWHCVVAPLWLDMIRTSDSVCCYTCSQTPGWLISWHCRPYLATYSIFLFIYLVSYLLRQLLVFRERVSLSSPRWPGTHCADQAGFKFTKIHISLSRECGVKGHATISDSL